MVDTGNDELFVLTRILTHADADRWMVNNEFRVNEATNALEVVDVSAVEAAVQAAADAAPGEGVDFRALFEHRRDREFAHLGVSADFLPALRAFTTDDQLQAFLLALPNGQAEAVMMLLGDEPVDDLYGLLAGQPSVSADPTDLAGAVTSPASSAQFRVMTDEADLLDVLGLPLAQWRIFLHPSQEQIAYRTVFNGPVRITGGAGTGKTVVAMHRAQHLASLLPASSGSTGAVHHLHHQPRGGDRARSAAPRWR